MSAPRFVFEEMGDYEVCLAELQRLHKRLRTARASERAEAQRAYDHALQRAREVGARLARELHAAHTHGRAA